jgi:uncharacterized protein YraI
MGTCCRRFLWLASALLTLAACQLGAPSQTSPAAPTSTAEALPIAAISASDQGGSVPVAIPISDQNAAALTVRTGPGWDFPPTERQLDMDQGAAVIGRTEDGSWLLVEFGSTQGWLESSQVTVSTSICTLPVVHAPSPTPIPTATPTEATQTPYSQPILLRRSCGRDYVVVPDTPISLYYGGWSSNGQELAEQWATSLVVDLTIDGERVQGRPNPPAADLPYNCPKDPDNSYWVYYTAFIPGLPEGVHQVGVTFHALRQLRDGYGDVLYGPGELLHQTFTVSAIGAPPVPSPAPTGTPVVMVDEANQAVVYEDVLGLGWEDWSWYSTADLASAEHAHSGAVSIKASLRSTGAVSLYYSGLDTTPYHWLEFYIYVGENTLRRISVYFNDTSDKELMPKVSVDDPAFIAGGTYIANRWQRVRIPLAATGGANRAIIRINFKDESGDGQSPFWIDGIRFVGAVPDS